MKLLRIKVADIISLAWTGKYDVIAHGCNCFCTMKRGIAPRMAEVFGCDKFHKERPEFKGDINKLGTIDYVQGSMNGYPIIVVNMYTQFHWEKLSIYGIPLDYDALRLCFRKLNHLFKDNEILIPWIGCGLAGGHKSKVRMIIEEECVDCNITIAQLPEDNIKK